MGETSLIAGRVVAGRYRLERLLGEGGMGTVWSAVHTVTRRAVALKFIREGRHDRAELLARLTREASTASALGHPNVVEVLDVFDFEAQTPVLVMELLQGCTLANKLQREERLSVAETAQLLLPVVSAVGSAHALGIVHRDLKPDNIFLAERDGLTLVKVLDFGIAKVLGESETQEVLSSHEAPLGVRGPLAVAQRSPATRSGSVLGTPCYMAPEQALGERDVDHRADIWALGVILYECLSGARPVEGENPAQLMLRLISSGIVPIAQIADVPEALSVLVTQMLSRDPQRRPATLAPVLSLLAELGRASAPDFAPPLELSPKTSSSPTLQGSALLALAAVDRALLVPGHGETWRSDSRHLPPSELAPVSATARRRASARVVVLGAGLCAALVVLFGVVMLDFAAGEPEPVSRSAASDLPSFAPVPVPSAGAVMRVPRDQWIRVEGKSAALSPPDASEASAVPQAPSARAAPRRAARMPGPAREADLFWGRK